MKMFQLKSLIILEGCRYCKKLKPGEYFLSEMDASWDMFFGKGLMLSAIVGKNGSGKSTLLELVFRIINNVNCYICSHLCKAGQPATYYIEGVKAILRYQLGEDYYEVGCNGSLIRIAKIGDGAFCKEFNYLDKAEKASFTISSRTELLFHFFYTIVINYSPLAYNEYDYDSEKIVGIDNKHKQCDIKGHENWVHHLFHKNDGYSVSINLNPFRNNGSIDANIELDLTRSRLSALLILYPDKILEKYTLHSITYHFNSYFFRKKLDELKSIKSDEEIIDEYSTCINRKGSCCNIILETLLGKRPRIDNIYKKAACLYICIKALTIAERYPHYKKYADNLSIDLLKQHGTKKQKASVEAYARKLKNDKSHVTLKMRQAIHFYTALNKNKELLHLIKRSGSMRPFSYSDYKLACGDKDQKNILLQMSIMPPSFFDFHIRVSQTEDKAKTPILLSHLSTGEKQFLYSTVSIMYHLLNLKSVPSQSDRIHYRNVLVVLDEAELSYHPEYQRTYIKKLLDLILRLNLTRTLNIHFLLTTHSPFMLSDIPKCNILCLDDGVNVSDKMQTPFCANINNIMSQNFFLSENGMIGEFAKEKVLDAFKAMDNHMLKKNKNIWTSASLRHLIDLIGDKMIQQQIRQKYLTSKYANNDDIELRIRQLNKEIEELQNRKQ